MSALAVAPRKYSSPSGIFLARFNARGEILWMNQAAREAVGPAKQVVSALTDRHLRASLLAFPWGKNWLLVGVSTAEPPGRMEKRAARLNGELLEITRHRGFRNQRLACMREVLEERRRATETRERLRAGANFVRALEADRGRIARDLHDNAGQSLVGILLNLELVERQLGSAKAEALARLERSRKLASLALDQIRRTSHDLHPPEWSGDFREAVESLVETMAARSKVQVETSGINLPPWLSAALKTTLYRVIQEALVNALRHSEASRIEIRASIERGEVRLVVEDNGRGFDVHSLPAQGTGIGLKSLRQRVTALGGRLEVSAAPGQGTRIEAFVPVREGTQ